MATYDPFLHGLHIGHNNGVLTYGNLCIIKRDCGRHSRLSRTQDTRRRQDTTTDLQVQYNQIGDDQDIVCVFSVCDNVPTPMGFSFMGVVPFHENKDTRNSFSRANENCLFYCRDVAHASKMRQSIVSLRQKLAQNIVSRYPDQKCLGILKRCPEYTKKNGFSQNQTSILAYQRERQRREGVSSYVHLADVNGSLGFMTNGRPPNGKLQSMSGPTVFTQNEAYKLSTSGIYFMRDIPIPSGRKDKSLYVIRHTVHPDYLNMIRKHFHTS